MFAASVAVRAALGSFAVALAVAAFGDVVPAWLAVILAAIFGVQAWCSSRRSRTARDDAKRQAELAGTAARAAEEAAAAAGRSAEAAERSATAHETQTQLMQDQADAAERFPWRIDHHGGWDYRLVNLTNTRKYDVGVEGEPVRNAGGETHLGEVDGRESVELDVFLAMQTRDRRITVSWRPTPYHTGDRWTQRISLP